MSKVLYEIPPLSASDCFHIVERHKSCFDYPIHQHREFELNYVEHARGVRRIVGDSVEEIGDFDLVLIGSEDLEHVWEQGSCTSRNIREITIQFPPDLFDRSMLTRNQFASIKDMLSQSTYGIAFPMEAIMSVYDIINRISGETDKFEQYLMFIKMLYRLSKFKGKSLASSSFSSSVRNAESRRISIVKDYINAHYSETITLKEVADMVSMSPASFSRFFRMRTGKTLSSYIIDMRLGNAARALVDTTKNISEICYDCGFNNISNFNRLFKDKRGVSPHEFRTIYKKKKVVV